MKRNLPIMAMAVLFLACVAVLLWWLFSAPGTIRITYQGSQFDPTIGAMGVFEVVNDANTPMASELGVYERGLGRWWAHGVGDYGVHLGGDRTFAPGSTNTLRILIPTNGGPYRLVLWCGPELPNGKLGPAQWRWRLAQALRYLRAPARLQARALGNTFPASQQFAPPQPPLPVSGLGAPVPPAAGSRR